MELSDGIPVIPVCPHSRGCMDIGVSLLWIMSLSLGYCRSFIYALVTWTYFFYSTELENTGNFTYVFPGDLRCGGHHLYEVT